MLFSVDSRAQSLLPGAARRQIAIHPLVGALVPMGVSSDALEAGPLSGGQLGVGLGRWRGPRAALVVTAFGARTRLRGPIGSDRRRATMFAYDLGLEFGGRLARGVGEARAAPVLSFLGIGAGGRTYVFESDATRTRVRTAGDGYISLGGELGSGRSSLRLELRNYWSRLDPRGRATGLRREMVASAGLAYHFR